MTFVMLKIDYTHIYERERERAAAALLVYMVLREHTLSPSHSFFLLHARTNQTSQFFLDNFQFVINAIFQGFNCFELKMHSMSFLSGCFTARIVRRSFWWVCACVCVQCMWVLWFVPIAYMSHCLQCRFCLNFSLFLFSFRMVHHLDPYWPIFTHLHIGESFFCSFFIQQWHASIDKNGTFVEPKKILLKKIWWESCLILITSFSLCTHTHTLVHFALELSLSNPRCCQLNDERENDMHTARNQFSLTLMRESGEEKKQLFLCLFLAWIGICSVKHTKIDFFRFCWFRKMKCSVHLIELNTHSNSKIKIKTNQILFSLSAGLFCFSFSIFFFNSKSNENLIMIFNAYGF